MKLLDYQRLDLCSTDFRTDTRTPGRRKVNVQPRSHCRDVEGELGQEGTGVPPYQSILSITFL